MAVYHLHPRLYLRWHVPLLAQLTPSSLSPLSAQWHPDVFFSFFLIDFVWQLFSSVFTDRTCTTLRDAISEAISFPFSVYYPLTCLRIKLNCWLILRSFVADISSLRIIICHRTERFCALSAPRWS